MNDPAFPYLGSKPDEFGARQHSGLTKRELFAMHFMPAIYEEFWKECHGFDDQWRVGLAKDAVMLADALLAELDKPA